MNQLRRVVVVEEEEWTESKDPSSLDRLSAEPVVFCKDGPKNVKEVVVEDDGVVKASHFWLATTRTQHNTAWRNLTMLDEFNN